MSGGFSPENEQRQRILTILDARKVKRRQERQEKLRESWTTVPDKEKKTRIDQPKDQTPPPAMASVVFAAVGVAILLSVGGYFAITGFAGSSDPAIAAVLENDNPIPRADLKNRLMTCKIGHVVPIPEQTFRMGSYRPTAEDQWPVRDVSLERFYIDSHEVTNSQFAQFVSETGYKTEAETRGWSYIFDRQTGEWTQADGASWSKPGGQHTSLEGSDSLPVVHVSWNDAAAYAEWAGGRLPTEAEWECAARAGLRDFRYPWGNDSMPEGRYLANARQIADAAGGDGYQALAPVGSFPANRYGMFDIVGNISEWCADWYDPKYYSQGGRKSPTGPSRGKTRVVRGGSWLSSGINSNEITVFNRGKTEPDLSYQTIGFRVVYDKRP